MNLYRVNLWVCTILTSLFLSGCVVAQGVEERFESLVALLERKGQDTSASGLRELTGLINTVATFPYEDDEVVRSRAEKHLRGILASATGERGSAVRAATILALGRIASSETSVRFLLKQVALADAKHSATPRQVARALGSLRNAEVVGALCRWGLNHRNSEARCVTLEALASLRHPVLVAAAREHAAGLIASLESRHPPILHHALRAAGNLGLRGLLPRIRRAAGAEDALVRQGAAMALQHLVRDPGVLSILHELLEDPIFWVREAAITSLSAAGDVQVCAFLIPRLRLEGRRVRALIFSGLRRLSGKNLADDIELWESWWQRERRKGIDPHRDPEAENKRVGSRSRYAVTYYGIPVRSDRVLFILDVSMSMRFGGSGDKPDRMDVARKEFASVLEHLPSDVLFSAFSFSTGNAYLQKRLLPATQANKRRATRWINSILPAGGTDSFGALKSGLEKFPEADTIFFLSDGRPSRGMIRDPEKIVARIAALNARRKVRINTIALLDTDPKATSMSHEDSIHVAARFMEQLAMATGGTFVRHGN